MQLHSPMMRGTAPPTGLPKQSVKPQLAHSGSELSLLRLEMVPCSEADGFPETSFLLVHPSNSKRPIFCDLIYTRVTRAWGGAGLQAQPFLLTWQFSTTRLFVPLVL